MPFEEPQINPFPENDSKREEYFSAGELLRKRYSDNFKALGQQIKNAPPYALAKKLEPKNPNAWVDLWYDRMIDFHKRHMDPESMAWIRNGFYEKYVIKPEDVPESYFTNQQRLAREQGHGDVEISEELKQQLIEIIIKDQRSTLDNWINYIFSPDADVYPMWARYLVIRNITKLSTYDKEKKSFTGRRNDTVAPFPDLNREALAIVVDFIVKKARKENIALADGNPELKKLIDSENFGKLYAYAIEKATPIGKKELMETDGEWVRYPRGSDHMPLVESLQGYGTGWCTAGEETAKEQLKGGDFYVYYSKNEEGQYAIPRVAIRMEGDRIGEVRGIGPNQNMDPFIGGVVDEKIKEFPDGAQYNKKVKDMELLTVIDRKQNAGQELTRGELIFLYEIDSRIEGFGYQTDPRIEEIIKKRDIKSDLAFALELNREEISLTQEEALRGGVKFHYGNLDLRGLQSAENLKLPETIGGDLYLRGLQSAENLKLPETISGSLYLDGLQFAEGLDLSQTTIGGNLDLHSLQSAEGLDLSQTTISGSLYLDGLQFAEGLDLSQTTISGSLYLHSLQSAENLKLPETISGSLYLGGLQSAENLKLPETISGSLYLHSLQSAENLKLPETIGGDLYLGGLQSAEGLDLSQTTIRGAICLDSHFSRKEMEKIINNHPSLMEKIKFYENR